RLDTTHGPIEADNVVIATGPYQEPIVPATSRGLPSEGLQGHWGGFRHPGRRARGRVARGRPRTCRLPDRRGPARGGTPRISLGGPAPPLSSPLPGTGHVLGDGASGRARSDARGGGRGARGA